MKVYDIILEGHEATEKNAVDLCNGLDWQDVETSEKPFSHIDYVNTINGIDIFYNATADYYYFAESDKF